MQRQLIVSGLIGALSGVVSAVILCVIGVAFTFFPLALLLLVDGAIESALSFFFNPGIILGIWLPIILSSLIAGFIGGILTERYQTLRTKWFLWGLSGATTTTIVFWWMFKEFPSLNLIVVLVGFFAGLIALAIFRELHRKFINVAKSEVQLDIASY